MPQRLSDHYRRNATLRHVVVFQSKHSSFSKLPRFFYLSSGSPTGDLLGKCRLPPHLSQPTMDIKNDSRTHGLSVSTIDCRAWVLRPSCASTIYINQRDLVMSPDMYACKTTPEPYSATIKLAPHLNQFFQNVPFDQLNFPSSSIGPAMKLESFQFELTKIADVRRMDPETLQKLSEPIDAHYTSLNPARAAALDNFIPAKTFLISGGSIVFLSFCLNLIFHFFTDRHVHFAVPNVASSRINLANLFMQRTTLTQTLTLRFSLFLLRNSLHCVLLQRKPG